MQLSDYRSIFRKGASEKTVSWVTLIRGDQKDVTVMSFYLKGLFSFKDAEPLARLPFLIWEFATGGIEEVVVVGGGRVPVVQ